MIVDDDVNDQKCVFLDLDEKGGCHQHGRRILFKHALDVSK